MNKPLRIAILGWGSLIWDKDKFFDDWHGDWMKDGPTVPVEFSRISQSRGNALTLVIDQDNGTEISSFYSFSKQRHPDDAFSDLRCREKTSNINIGMINLKNNKSQSRSTHVIDIIKTWAIKKEIDVVVWTDLKSNFEQKKRKTYSTEEAYVHLKGLKKDSLFQAIEYIENAPEEIVTPLSNFLKNDDWYQKVLKQHVENNS